MPQRQQTQGDFGLRPTKVTQGITDVYHAPSIPKPDNSGLEAIANLSKTAMGLIKEQHNLDIAHKKEGLAYGEANPNAELEEGGGLFTRGTTEAAMAGFEQGRGNALRETFRTNVTNEWATLIEQNEDLKLQEDAYPAFLQQRESEFVQQQGIDGLSLSSFGSGREAWMLDEVHKNNISSIKYRKDVFKTDMKEVTASAIGNLEHISQLDDLDGSGWMNYIESTFIDENDAGGQVNLPDGSWIGFRDLSAEDFDRVDVRDAMRHQVKNDFVQSNVVPMIQEILQRGYDIGGATEQEVRAAVADDLIASLKSGENPEETMMILNTLQSGTGLFRNTKEFTAKYEENRLDIEENRIESRNSYIHRIEMFALADSIDENTTPEAYLAAIKQVRSNIGNFLTEDMAFAIESKIISNWDSASGVRDDMALRAEYVKTAFGRVGSATGAVTRESASSHVEAIKRDLGITVTEDQFLKGVQDAILTNGDAQFPQDLGKRANYVINTMQENGVFATIGPSRIIQKLNLSAGRLMMNAAPKDMMGISEAYHLYTAAESSGMLSKLKLSARDAKIFEEMQYQVVYKGLTHTQAVADIQGRKEDFTADFKLVTAEEARVALGEGKTRGRLQLTMDIARSIQLGEGVDGETAADMAVELQKEHGFTTIGEGDGEHSIQLTQGVTPAELTFNNNVEFMNGNIAHQVRTQFEEDREALGAIVRELTKPDGVYGGWREEQYEIDTQAELGRTFLTGYESRIVRREFQDEVWNRALQIYTEENGRQAMQAQGVFKDAGLQDWDDDNNRIGIVSNSTGLAQQPSYSVVNLATGIEIHTIGDKAIGVNMTPEQMNARFHKETMEYMNLMEEWKLDPPRHSPYGGDS